MADVRLAFAAILVWTVLLSGCFWQQGQGNYTNYTTNTGIEYVNCTAKQPSLITIIKNPAYSPEYAETEPYLRQISEPSGMQVSLTGTIKTMTLAEGTLSEWSYDYFETDDGAKYILYGKHWSAYPDFEYGNFAPTGEIMNKKVNVTGQKVTIYPMGKDETSYGDYGPQDGILITSIEGHESVCCYQKTGEDSYSPLICIWK